MIINFAKLTTLKGHILTLRLIMLVTMSLVFAGSPSIGSAQEFDHDETNFPLDFVHAREKCDSCHIQGVFRGTPLRCYECHSNSGRIQASSPSPGHINSTEDCEFCHQSGNWDNVARVDHFAVNGECQNCHNGVVAQGKNPGHIQSSDICDNCHRTNSWEDAVFDHSGITGNCQLCHNGVIATGKNAGHIPSTETCEDCHNTISFDSVTRVDHSAVIGSCSYCHNDILAIGKPADHILTNEECDVCHTTVNWSSNFKPAGHFITNRSCDDCHASGGWTTIIFVHAAASYPDHGRNILCTDCHGGNSEAVTWSDAGLAPQCAGCHSGDFDPSKHEASGGGFETVAQNADCSGSCHQDTSHHRVTDPGWNR